MRLVHTTPAKNVQSIREFGVLLSYCRSSKRVACWVHAASKNRWCETHVRVTHDCFEDQLAHIYIDVPMEMLKKHADGLYYVFADLRPEWIERIMVTTPSYSQI